MRLRHGRYWIMHTRPLIIYKQMRLPFRSGRFIRVLNRFKLTPHTPNLARLSMRLLDSGWQSAWRSAPSCAFKANDCPVSNPCAITAGAFIGFVRFAGGADERSDCAGDRRD